MKPEEFIKLMLKRAQGHPINKKKEEADEFIVKLARDLYRGLDDGKLRISTVRGLKEALSTLPEKPTEEDTNITIRFIESIIITVISYILTKGEILTITSIKDKDKKQPEDKYEI